MIIYDVVSKKSHSIEDSSFGTGDMGCDCLIAGSLDIGRGFSTECGMSRFAALTDDGEPAGTDWNWSDRKETAALASRLYAGPSELIEAMHRIDMLEQAIALHREKAPLKRGCDVELWKLIDSAEVAG